MSVRGIEKQLLGIEIGQPTFHQFPEALLNGQVYTAEIHGDENGLFRGLAVEAFAFQGQQRRRHWIGHAFGDPLFQLPDSTTGRAGPTRAGVDGTLGSGDRYPRLQGADRFQTAPTFLMELLPLPLPQFSHKSRSQAQHQVLPESADEAAVPPVGSTGELPQQEPLRRRWMLGGLS